MKVAHGCAYLPPTVSLNNCNSCHFQGINSYIWNEGQDKNTVVSSKRDENSRPKSNCLAQEYNSTKEKYDISTKEPPSNKDMEKTTCGEVENDKKYMEWLEKCRQVLDECVLEDRKFMKILYDSYFPNPDAFFQEPEEDEEDLF